MRARPCQVANRSGFANAAADIVRLLCGKCIRLGRSMTALVSALRKVELQIQELLQVTKSRQLAASVSRASLWSPRRMQKQWPLEELQEFQFTKPPAAATLALLQAELPNLRRRCTWSPTAARVVQDQAPSRDSEITEHHGASSLDAHGHTVGRVMAAHCLLANLACVSYAGPPRQMG